MDLLIAGIAVGILVLISIVWRRKPFIPSVRGKHVFLTGASSGIGLAVAKEMLQEGAFITLLARNPDKLEKAAKSLLKELECPAERIRVKTADVGNYKAISTAVRESYDWRPIDILINNAGITRSGFMEEVSVEDMNAVVQTNLLGSVYPLHAALTDLKMRSRSHPISIVFIGSLASLCWLYGNGVYTSTKYAIKGIAECLRLELAPYNIRVNLVCPGFVESAFLDDACSNEEVTTGMQYASFFNRGIAQSPQTVARIILAGIKSGTFLITTTPGLGPICVTLTRGFAPAESFLRNLFEAFFIVPLRLVSTFTDSVMRWQIIRLHRKHNPRAKQVD